MKKQFLLFAFVFIVHVAHAGFIQHQIDNIPPASFIHETVFFS